MIFPIFLRTPIKQCAAGVLFAVVVLVLTTASAQAQVPQSDLDSGIPRGVQISPIRFEADMRPGETWQGTINLKNFAADTKTIHISAENFVVTSDTERATFYPSDEARHLQVPDIVDWIMIPEPDVTLAADEARNVPFMIVIPDDAPTGGYYGALFFLLPSHTVDTGAQTQLNVNSRMGALLVIAVRGSESVRIEGGITRFAAARDVFFRGPVRLETSIVNSGNLHFRGAGTITVTRWGRTKTELPLISQVNYPDRTRTYENQWSIGIFDIGPHTATVRYTSLSDLVRLEATTTFWVIPWTAIAILVVCITTFGMLWRYIVTHFDIRRKTTKNI